MSDVLQEVRHNPDVDVAQLTPHAWTARIDQDAMRRQQRQQAAAQLAAAVMSTVHG